MVQHLRIALLVLFLGASAIVVWNLLAETDRISQSNVPGVDPGNPLAQYGIESNEHQAYVAAKIRNARYLAVQIESGSVTVANLLWVLIPDITRERPVA